MPFSWRIQIFSDSDCTKGMLQHTYKFPWSRPVPIAEDTDWHGITSIPIRSFYQTAAPNAPITHLNPFAHHTACTIDQLHTHEQNRTIAHGLVRPFVSAMVFFLAQSYVDTSNHLA